MSAVLVSTRYLATKVHPALWVATTTDIMDHASGMRAFLWGSRFSIRFAWVIDMRAAGLEYYFVLYDRDERDPIATPDKDTANKPFESEVLPPFDRPLVFFNGARDYQKANGISPLSPPPEILFCGSDLLVKTALQKALVPMKLPGLAIQPAIFIDDKGDWHEDYWYLTFLSMLDCWDRTTSTFFPDRVQMDGIQAHSVHTYSLNEQVLSELPLESRLLFKMGGTSDGFVVAHKSIVDLFRRPGSAIVPVADYGVRWP